ncbi:MAG: 50S ribosomal protein L20 [Patescibacteria group bacterium]|nr:50S ribosomal protein L20 [Patescibacteria group bacterium]MDE1966314.1 50S ribosomal protein L20 [Patescibacteria group bacterium]
MPRVKGGMMSAKHRRNVLKRVKGYRHGRSKKERQAHEALLHAGKHAFKDRREKKNVFRQLWIVRLNAAVRENGQKSYSTFIGKLKKRKIELDRKVLAEFAAEYPEIFARIAKNVG